MPEPLDSLLDLDRRLLRVEDRDALDQVLVEWALASGADGAWSGQPDAGNCIRFRASGGDGMAEYLRAVTIRTERGTTAAGPAGRAWRTGQIQTTADLHQAADMEAWRTAADTAGWRSLTAIPLVGPGGPVGILTIYSRTPGRFSTPPWSQLLEHVALVAGMTLHRLTLALTDHLTGLPNRRALEAQLEGALTRSVRHERLLGVGVLDLDDFKPINDRHGHELGDQVLKEVAQRLKAALRSNDFVARMGGDEFVVIFEDIEDLDDLEPLLERVHTQLTAPLTIDRVTVRVGGSLGLVIYPLCEQQSPGEVLRIADLALYRTKARKGRRTTWWSLPGEEQGQPLHAESKPAKPSADAVSPYGYAAAHLLGPLHEFLARATEGFLVSFRDFLAENPGPAKILGLLSDPEIARLENRITDYFRLISEPALTEERHRKEAAALGRVHCIMGVDLTWLIHIYNAWLNRFRQSEGPGILRSQLALPVLTRRLTLDAEFQRAGYQDLARERELTRARIDALAWTSERYADLIEGAVQTVIEMQEVAAAAIARPNERSVFLPEAMAGEACKRYLEAVQAGSVPPLSTDPAVPGGHGSGPASWRTQTIQRNTHFADDAEVSPWRDLALGAGVRSVAAVPLSGAGGRTEAILLLLSPYPGGLNSIGQQALLEHLERTLSLGIARIETGTGRPQVQALPERQHYRALLRTEALVMHYQPILDLRTGHLARVEALARLKDEAELTAPDRFLPVFVAEDLFDLYRFGLSKALMAVREWAAAGLLASVSVNLPPEGLLDSRYLEVTRHALNRHSLPAGCRLSLELLETKDFARTDVPLAQRIAPYRALGVEFAEDDLGTGYSSLARLRELPFDTVKIDKSLTLPGRKEPARLLSLIGQLTELAHALGARIAVEGLENAPLIEAVATLGADCGQGFEISPPLPASDIPAWTSAHLPWTGFDPGRPRSALAALAGLLQWQARAASLSDNAPSTPAVPPPAAVDAYLKSHALQNSTLALTLHRLRRAELAGGPHTTDYRRHHQRLVALLTEQVQAEARNVG